MEFPEMPDIPALHDAPAGWHLDKSIGVALVVATLLQVCTGSWYASKAFSSIDDLERRTTLLEATMQSRITFRDAQIAEMRASMAATGERLARLEASAPGPGYQSAPSLIYQDRRK